MKLTEDMFRSIAPYARNDYVLALTGDAADAEFKKWAIDTPLRMVATLATAATETGGFTILHENMNYTAARIRAVWPSRPEAVKFAGNPEGLANCVYNGRMGNRPGSNDGWVYRGCQLNQLTGRENFRKAGLAIGVDLEGHPELLEDAVIGVKVLCWEMAQWLPYCDLGQQGWRSVCNAVNRGNPNARADPIGWGDRQAWYKKFCRVLGIDGMSTDASLRIGSQGGLVLAAQQRLAELGYAAGAADGIFGSRTRAAVLAFQAENNLTIDGKIGPETVAALNSDDAKSMPLGDRAAATADDLRKAGSETIAHSDAIKGVSGAGAAVSVTAGVAQSVTSAIDTSAPPPAAPVDLIATTKDVITEVGSWKAITDSLGATFHWATSHWWVFAIVACFAFWKWGNSIELRRLLDHRSGANMGR